MNTAVPLSTATLNDELFEQLTDPDRTEVSDNVIRGDQDLMSLIWHVPTKPHVKGHTLYIQLRGGRVPAWLSPVVERLDHLLNLDEDWDSYGSCTIDLSVAERVIKFLDLFLDDDTPRPDIVPTSEGGVQLEWEKDEKELELEFRPNGSYVVLFQDPQNEEAGEVEKECQDSYSFYIVVGRLLKDIFNAGV